MAIQHAVQGQPLSLYWGCTSVQLSYSSKLFIIEIARWCSGSRKQKTVQIRMTVCSGVFPLYALGARGIRYWGNTV